MESQSGYCLPVIYHPFDASRRGHWTDRGSLFDFLLATEGEGTSLLDFGPGDGWPSLIVAPFAREVTGVDGSAKRVEVCRQNARRLGIANASFVHVEPGQKLPFQDGGFDGAMAASSIEQTPDPRATLGELCRVLRPGGRLRMSYESLGAYRDCREREAQLERIDANSCRLTLYDRQIDRERARMVRLEVDRSLEEVTELVSRNGKPSWDLVQEALLNTLRGCVRDAGLCILHHPSGATFLRWLRDAGFRRAEATCSGSGIAGELFDATPPQDRPVDMHGVDALIRPPIGRAVRTPASVSNPHGFDAMITAVK
jgi:SAM-dependent methyltransferase